MPKLLVQEGTYYSQLDEDAFFHWLTSIGGVVRVVGTPKGLEVTLRSSKLSERSLRDLLAIHFRYGLAMRSLALFETRENRPWFRSPDKYWYAAVFGNR
jgi:hypothetical protein